MILEVFSNLNDSMEFYDSVICIPSLMRANLQETLSCTSCMNVVFSGLSLFKVFHLSNVKLKLIM